MIREALPRKSGALRAFIGGPLADYFYRSKLCTTNNTAINPKLIAVNIRMYFFVFSGLCFLYSEKVIKLAKEAIKVPSPPIFIAGSRL